MWVGFCLAISLLAACSAGDALRESTPSSQLAPPPSLAATSTPEHRQGGESAAPPPTPGHRYAYLPALTALPVHRVGETASIVWEGHPLLIKLVGLDEPEAVPPGIPLRDRTFLTTMAITNTGPSDILVSLDRLLQGMNGSGSRLDDGGRVQLANPLEIRLPAQGSTSADLLWHTPAHADDMRIWLTANMAIQDGGYVRELGDGAVFSFALTELDYPLGTPTPCAMAAGYVRDTIADNAAFAPGQRFEKTWVIQNSGTCRWAEGSTWSHFGGDALGVVEALPVGGVVLPGDLVTVTVTMTAPLESGIYRGDWRLRAPSGDFYGRSFYAQIVVSDTLALP